MAKEIEPTLGILWAKVPIVGFAALICAIFISGCAAGGGTLPPPPPPPTYSFLRDDHGPTQDDAYVYFDYSTTPPGGGVAGPSQSTSPYWHINQYGNPAPIQPTSGPSHQCSSSPLWSLGSPSTGLCWIPDPASGRYDVVLAQTGQAALPNQLACGTEYDLFFGPDNFHPVPEFQNSPALSAMKSLHMGVTFQLQSTSVMFRCGATNPWLDQSQAIAAVVLTNYPKRQTLFYNLVLTFSTDTFSRQCTGGAYYWWGPEPGDANVYGASERLGTAYGLPCPTVGGPAQSYTVDILRSIKYFILNAPNGGLDTNFSDWTVSGAFFGNIVVGGGTVTEKWNDISLEAELVP